MLTPFLRVQLALMMLLGIGGFPRGRIIEILDQNLLVRPPYHYIALSLRLRSLVVFVPLSMRARHGSRVF